MIQTDSDQSLNLIKEQQTKARLVYDMLSKVMYEESVMLFNAINNAADLLGSDYNAVVSEMTDETLEYIENNPYVVLAGGAARDWWRGQPAKDMDMYIMLHNVREFWGSCNRKLGVKGSLIDYKNNNGVERNYFVDDPKNKDKRNPIMAYIGDKMIENGMLFTKLVDKTIAGDYRNQFIACVFEMHLDGHVFDLIFMDSSKAGPVYLPSKKTFWRLSFLDFSREEDELVKDPTPGAFVISTYDYNICRAYYDFNAQRVVVMDEFIEDFKNKTLTIYSGCDTNLLHNAIYRHLPKLVEKFPNFKFNPVKSEQEEK